MNAGIGRTGTRRKWRPTKQRDRLVFDDLAKALLAVSEHSRPVLYVDNVGVKYKIYPGGKIRRCKYNTKPPAAYYQRKD